MEKLTRTLTNTDFKFLLDDAYGAMLRMESYQTLSGDQKSELTRIVLEGIRYMETLFETTKPMRVWKVKKLEPFVHHEAKVFVTEATAKAYFCEKAIDTLNLKGFEPDDWEGIKKYMNVHAPFLTRRKNPLPFIYDIWTEIDYMFEVPACPHCASDLEPSEIDGYSYSCNDCDEDFFSFEV